MERKPGDRVTVRCEVCRMEIPRSEAKSAEGLEYTVYFCGLPCFEKWQADELATEDSIGGD